VPDLLNGVREVLEHEEGYQRAKKYYQGLIDEYFANARVRIRLQESGLAYRINFAKTPVDVIADRLEIASVTVAGQDALTQVFMDRVWNANQLDLHFPEIFTKTGTYGDGYLIVWPTSNSTGDMTGVSVDYNSPERVRVFYDDENPRIKKMAVKVWREGKRTRTNLYYPDRIERYITKLNMVGKTDDEWEEYTDDEAETWPIVNPYNEVPVFHLRNQFTYGRPDHRDAYGPQDAINKLVATQMHNVDQQGWPQRYALVDEKTILDRPSEGTGTDTDAIFDEEDAADLSDSGSNLGGSIGDVRNTPDSMVELHGVKSVGAFPVADPNALLKPAEFYIRAMAQVTETPLHRFYPQGDRPSGESLRVEEAPLVKKVKYRQAMYGAALKDAFEFAMRILLDAEVVIDIRWTQAGSYDDKASWEVASAKLDAGVPQSQVLQEAGYTKEQVDSWLKDANEFDLARRVQLVNQIGQAMERLAVGVGAGIITNDQAGALIQRLMGQADVTAAEADKADPEVEAE